jgi:hypothetical protein
MADFVPLERSIHRATLLAAAVCSVLLVITIGSVAAAVHLAWQVRRSSSAMPVLVVPGAIAGVYSPGLSQESLRGAARYLAGLGTNFGGPPAMEQRFDELESFASPRYLPLLQRARAQLRRDVQSQGQARAFYGTPGREQLTQVAPGRFEYSQEGERHVFAGGLAMEQRSCIVKLTLVQAAASQQSPLGIALERFEVVDLPAALPAVAATAAAVKEAERP